jgi:hypothetical protein
VIARAVFAALSTAQAARVSLLSLYIASTAAGDGSAPLT